ncbi:type VI secretion system protein VasG [Granulicella aggregans]|uniref:Type VI secretion system protein VasG n=1 Tax=Granulicella aggregans TaxID=474949 RepID=A0A7W8E7L0_9BACT|nr:type VI secretion system ATPase TssH [Granulicella aggregans]MBB5060380.1 type VI secretion system protein VasG [Granulicella aggregans]
MITSVKPLVQRFDDATRQAMEGAAGLCLSRTHYEVEIEHFFTKALETEAIDLTRILQHFDVNRDRLDRDLQMSLKRLKTGNPRGPVFSNSLVAMFREAWSFASLALGATRIRTGHALLALLSEESLARMAAEISREFEKVSAEALSMQFAEITAGSSEDLADPSAGHEIATKTGAVAAAMPHLDQYTEDLTQAARQGKIEPVVGRDAEIRQMIDVLMRRRQNNPILTGEAGVGKTAVVEGLALRIAHGDVPEALKQVRLHNLDLTLLQARASVKGEFEGRLKGLLREVKSSPQPVILFIDEAHSLIGAGGQAGQGDAANILKPALARGELRTIAATTWAEYKRYFEKDAALTRRFQVIKIEEPSEALCETMLLGILPSLEKHHQIRVLDEAVSAAVRLSHRYMPGRQLPDKAVSVLDTACARVSLSQSTQPIAMEELARQIAASESRMSVLEREQLTGSDHSEQIAQCTAERQSASEQLVQMEARWHEEKSIVEQIISHHRLIEQLQSSTEGVDSEDALAKQQHALEELRMLRSQLRSLQAQPPLAHPAVDAHVVATVVAEWTGIPLGKMVDDEALKLLHLEDHLKQRIVGQDHALHAIAQRIWTSRANLEDPVKPIGVFMLAGPSGVGKTETALALADLLYGGEQNLITINMSEFQEPHSVSTLKGAPPGYVGYGEGGVLTEAVRRQPYSVVLLDEVEKAHHDVLELFFQVFDKGHLEDGEGRSIDFRHTLILLTTNAASATIAKLSSRVGDVPSPAELVSAIRPELNHVFKPAFLGRTLVVPYLPVRDEVLKQIIRLKIGKIQRRLATNHHVELDYDDALVELLARRCLEVESGARNVDHLLSNTVLPELSRTLLSRLAESEVLERVAISTSPEDTFTYAWTGGEAVVNENLATV